MVMIGELRWRVLGKMLKRLGFMLSLLVLSLRMVVI